MKMAKEVKRENLNQKKIASHSLEKGKRSAGVLFAAACSSPEVSLFSPYN
jgi:hypothetical protein